MKLRIPEFVKNKIEQGKNYKVDNPIKPVLVLSLGDDFAINKESVEKLFAIVNDIKKDYPKHNIQAYLNSVGRIL